MLERDVWKLFKKYIRKSFIFDVLANIPISLYYFINGFPSEPETLERVADDPAFIICMAFKTLRLYHLSYVTDTLRRLMDLLSEIFYMKRYMFVNLLSWTLTIFKFIGAVHYFACGWVMIHYYKERYGMKHIEFSEDTIFTKYFESVYAMTTSITTVGYGDYKGYNDNGKGWSIEMGYLILVIIFGIILFSSVTNEIFNYRKV